jgi:hypothetical protein
MHGQGTVGTVNGEGVAVGGKLSGVYAAVRSPVVHDRDRRPFAGRSRPRPQYALRLIPR